MKVNEQVSGKVQSGGDQWVLDGGSKAQQQTAAMAPGKSEDTDAGAAITCAMKGCSIYTMA